VLVRQNPGGPGEFLCRKLRPVNGDAEGVFDGPGVAAVILVTVGQKNGFDSFPLNHLQHRGPHVGQGGVYQDRSDPVADYRHQGMAHGRPSELPAPHLAEFMLLYKLHSAFLLIFSSQFWNYHLTISSGVSGRFRKLSPVC